MKTTCVGGNLGDYLEGEGEGEICMEQTYLMEERRIPQESSRIAKGEPWSPRSHPQVVGVDLERNK
jgi:hypothetical protein